MVKSDTVFLYIHVTALYINAQIGCPVMQMQIAEMN